MPFKIVRNDITRMAADAIVNTANPNPIIGRGTDSDIYEAAGRELLLKDRQRIGKIPRGEAAITPGYGLQAKYIIHTVGPKWIDGTCGEAQTLRSCYENSLRLAKENGCESIAFPLISTGIYGFPKDLALQIVISTVSAFLTDEEMMIYLVVYDEKANKLSQRLFSDVEQYIDDNYVHIKMAKSDIRYSETREASRREPYDRQRYDESEICNTPSDRPRRHESASYESRDAFESASYESFNAFESAPHESFDDFEAKRQAKPSKRLLVREPSIVFGQSQKKEKKRRSLDELLKQSEETFQQMLLRLIQEKGMTNAQVYKRANQGKQLFSKIKQDVNYQPKKKTAMAFAIALELSLDEAKDLLARAGYAFSPSNDFDITVQFFIANQNYNIYEIEVALYDRGLESLCNYA